MRGIRVLVCGGDGYCAYRHAFKTMAKTDKELGPLGCVVTRGKNGVDLEASWWAQKHHRETREYLGDARRIVDEVKPDLVIAFPQHRDTTDAVSQARKAGVTVIEVNP